MTTTDPVGTALWSIGAGSTSGAVAIASAMLVLRTLQANAPEADGEGTGAAVVLAGLVVGLSLAVAFGWMRSRAIDDLWRRGVISALCVFGASLLSLVAVPVDLLLGRPGLLAYAMLLLVAATIAGRAGRPAAEAR